MDYGNGSAGDGWVAIGKNSKANTFVNGSGASTALGYDAIAEGEYSSAMGSRTHAIGGASMALGLVQYQKAIEVSRWVHLRIHLANTRWPGSLFKALGKLSIAMGDYSKADGANAIALGKYR